MEAVAEPPKHQAINVKLMVPFVNAIRNVFSTMLRTPVTIQRPVFKAAAVPQYDVSAIIGFSGEVVGSVVVSFPKAVAVKAVAAAFGGIEVAPDSPDFADGVGEITNMIAGGAKKDLGVNASISCPSVIIGAGHIVARLRDVPCLSIPCESALGAFVVEVSIKEVKG